MFQKTEQTLNELSSYFDENIKLIFIKKSKQSSKEIVLSIKNNKNTDRFLNLFTPIERYHFSISGIQKIQEKNIFILKGKNTPITAHKKIEFKKILKEFGIIE